jgi:hypothetical protein
MTRRQTFDQWFAQYAPTAPECLDECARAAWGAAAHEYGAAYRREEDRADKAEAALEKVTTAAARCAGESGITEECMKEKVQAGHRRYGRWILAPVSDITTPKPGRICYGPRWWAVTKNDEVLFFDCYGSPQCNASEAIAARLGKGFDAPATALRFIDMAFLP